MRQALVTAIVFLASTFAYAQPSEDQERLVLADPDLELLRSLENALAPRKIAVVRTESTPASNEEADSLAKEYGARFIAWRRDGQMIVYDVTSSSADQQETKPGPLDPPDAAAAAELVKTLMHLPPPEGERPEHPPTSITQTARPPAPVGGVELRGQLGVGVRVTRGDDRAISARITGVVLVRPWGDRPVRFGIAGEGGPTAKVEKMIFRGTWLDWSVLGLASWSFVNRNREVEPFVGAGVNRTLVRGDEGDIARSESATMPLFRVGGTIRWRVDRWTIGASLAVDLAPTAPAFDTSTDDGPLYQVSKSALSFGLFAAADLGR